MIYLLSQLTSHARHRPGAVAYQEITSSLVPPRILTYGRLAEQVDSFAGRLRAQFPPGSSFILRIPNTCDYPIAFLAVLAADCAAFPVSADISIPELQSAVTQSSASAIITTGLTITATSLPPAALRRGILLQSSGTTGHPKIVYRDASSLDAVCANMVSAIGFTDADRVLATVPLCHSYGLEHGLLAPVAAGSSIQLCQGFDLHLVLQQLSSAGITIFPAVPSMFEMLARLASATHFSTLRVAYSAGAPLPATIADAFRTQYALPISQLYGASEIGSVTFTHPRSPGFNSASVGQPMNGVELRITQPNGEILVRATSMFAGYLNGESTLTQDGFFPTGDLGRLDVHGNLVITGRIKLLIDVGGLKVNPLEVEDVLRQHPAVGDCVVVPIRLSDTISRIKAVIRPTDPALPPLAEDLRKFARARLTPHKIPRVFEFRDALPTSPAGKILRHLIDS